MADRARHAGRVELWPLAPAPPKPALEPWEVPEANEGRPSSRQALADAVAAWIARNTDGSATLESRGRPMAPGGVMVDGQHKGWGEIVEAWFAGDFGEAVGRGHVRKVGTTKQMPPFWEVGCVGVEVHVDEETGQIRVNRLVTVGDVGCAINPLWDEAMDRGRLYGIRLDGQWIHVGTPQGLEDAETYLRDLAREP